MTESPLTPKQKIARAVEEAVSNPGRIEKVIEKISPLWAAKRRRASVFLALTGGFTGASKTRRSLLSFLPGGNDIDSDLLPDLPSLRERCRDLERNNPIAHGAIATKVVNVIGPGLRHKSVIDREVLNMTDDEANAWERQAERRWRLFWESQECDLARSMCGAELEWMTYKQVKVNGEAFVLFPRRKVPGSPFSLKIQIIESDRCKNEKNVTDSSKLIAGVEKNGDGTPVRYHFLDQHPGNKLFYDKKSWTWTKVDAFGRKSGLRNVLHIYRHDRPGQTRGIPDLSAVIEPLKQIGKYSEAEIDAAVISAFFTVFIKSESGDGELGVMEPTTEVGGKTSDKDYRLGKGAVLGLAPGEDISTASPGRPNSNFDPFVMSIMRQVGMALNLPLEVLMKHFQSSYSAARAALLDAWKYFISERFWFARKFDQAIYEIFLYEEISSGRLAAPGFFADPMIRKAFSGATWTGPAKGMIDEKKEIEAAEKKVGLTISTLSEVTAELTGSDWEQKFPQAVRELRLRQEAGFGVLPTAPAAGPAAIEDDSKGGSNDDGIEED